MFLFAFISVKTWLINTLHKNAPTHFRRCPPLPPKANPGPPNALKGEEKKEKTNKNYIPNPNRAKDEKIKNEIMRTKQTRSISRVVMKIQSSGATCWGSPVSEKIVRSGPH